MVRRKSLFRYLHHLRFIEPFGRSVSSPDDIGIMAFNVEKGLNYFESLGVGGMNTRGMGR